MSSLETVTVLFTDLVGSTGLATRVGPAAADELRREHFAVLREAVEATGGREVKNVGDGLMVVFQSCSSAVACGVGMQQRLELRNRRADEQFTVRIGISMGEADVEEGDYFGPPVVEAARLCDAAAGGQILAGELVRMMAREGHAFRSVGALELKGLPEAVAAHEVEWQPSATGALPLPPRLREVPPVGYVGRREEREGLSFLFDQAREGSRRVAFISGEPGIGKTRLATQLAVQAHGDGATVLYGRCDEEVGIPYGVWVGALRHYLTAAPEDVLRAHAQQHGGELSRLLPEVRSRVADYPEPRQTDAETERHLLFGAVAGLLEAATSEAPLVLILDDLHWADAPSLSLLRHVVTSDGPMNLLVLGTYRDSELARGHPLAVLLADLHREEGVSRIPLTGLEEPNVIALMEAAAGHELDDSGRSLAHAILRETDGNPFYVAEILRHLVEIGAVVQGADGRFRVKAELDELALPQSVREVVGRRVERLSEPSRRALGVAAVIGRDFEVNLLARVLETDEDALLDLLEEAAGASVVDESSDPVGRFTFAHALINHTLYEDLGRTRRARLHARIAEALEEICGDDPSGRVAELAHHWGRATTADRPSKAIRYARLAGERALDELAPDEALRWFKQSMELLGDVDASDPAEHCDLLIGLGDALRQLGDPSHRETLLEAGRLAADLGDADRAARAAFANHRGINSVFGVVDEERIAALEQAVELDGLRSPARSARLISRRAVELQHDPDHERRWALADEALALARHAGDARTLANVLFEHRYATIGRDDVHVMRALSDEMLELAEGLDDPALRVWVGLLDVGLLTYEGNLAAAEAELDRMTALASDLGQPVLRWFAAYIEATMRYVRGDLPATERAVEEAFAIGTQSAQADALMIYGAGVMLIRTAQDRVGEVVGLLEQTAAAYPGLPAWRAVLAATYALLGEAEKASQLLTESARQRFEDVYHDQIYLSTLVRYADAAFQTEHRDAASVLYQTLEPWADVVTWDGASSHGQVRAYLGMLAAVLGEDERADEQLRSASEFHERAGMPMFAAYGRLRWAEALARRGDAEAARREAASALDIAREVGYVLVERRAAALLESEALTPGRSGR